jgi:hypothetical protein
MPVTILTIAGDLDAAHRQHRRDYISRFGSKARIGVWYDG